MIYHAREDSLLLAEQVKKYARGKRVLDIGSGFGILAETALKSGALDVIACDIDNEAVKFLKDKGIDVIQSNLFSKIKGEFDLIVFNPPYLPSDAREDSESRRATTGGKKGDEIIVRFLRSLNEHLATEGISLIAISSLTPKKRILFELKKQNLNYKVLSSRSFFFETLEVWEIKREKEK
jgi:release factor glutamine methyltransferase